MNQYIIALDQGTTSSRCILFDRKGRICSVAQKEFRQIFPQPGWVEHDPLEIWSSQWSVLMDTMGKAGVSAGEIAAIGITNQRETTIVWDRKTGQPVYNAIVWQCRRTSEQIDRMKADGFDQVIYQKTGLIADAYFSATKVAWILENVPDAREKAERGELLFGTVDTWLVWNLTGGRAFVTDRTNASRTMMCNIHTMEWDDQILEYLNIPKCMLPEIRPSSELYGYTAEGILKGRIPIAGMAGDQQCALFGQCCFESGQVKNTYGTGCFLLMNTGTKCVESTHGLITTVAAGVTEEIQYVLEGSVFVAGAAVQWLRDGLQLIQSAAQSEKYAASVEDTAGVYVVPAFTGLGAPYWNQYVRGTVTGLTRGCTREHFVRAVLESLAYQTSDILKAMEQDSDLKITQLKVDGGACSNNFLMQFQADILDAQVIRPVCIETTALGAAYLAGLAVGFWDNLEDIRNHWELERTFQPKMARIDREERLKGWKRAVKCALAWCED